MEAFDAAGEFVNDALDSEFRKFHVINLLFKKIN